MSTALATTTLDQLAEDINQAHHEAEKALNAGLAHAFRVGELLAEAKAQCKHGTFIAWVENNFDGAVRTAQAYMKLAGRRAEIEANAQPVAHLGVKEALKLTAVPKPKEYMPPSEHIDKDVLATIPELSPEVILYGFVEDNFDCVTELHPCVGHDGYYHLVVYQGLTGEFSSVTYDKRGVRYSRQLLSAVLPYYHDIRPTLWQTGPATGEAPEPIRDYMEERATKKRPA